jgi:hypothetical protein
MIREWRRRLGDLSWFMKSVNEPLARIANKEDNCTGHFWEGRFGCTALLDDPAVLAGMAYVGLNPIKSGLTKSLERSDYTSIQSRLRNALLRGNAERSNKKLRTRPNTRNPVLAPVFGTQKATDRMIPIRLDAYLELLRAAMEKKRIARKRASEFTRSIEYGPPAWSEVIDQFDRMFTRASGLLSSLSKYIESVGRKRCVDVRGSMALSEIAANGGASALLRLDS